MSEKMSYNRAHFRIFLKYISEAFSSLYEKLQEGKGEYKGSGPEDKDEYKAANVFFVPEIARWAFLVSKAKLPDEEDDFDFKERFTSLKTEFEAQIADRGGEAAEQDHTGEPEEGAIMSGWKDCLLSDFIKVKHGYAFAGDNITDKDTSNVLVTPGNFHIGGGFKSDKFKFIKGEYPQEYKFKGGEIIITMTDLSKETDALGYAAKVPFKTRYSYLHNQRVGLVEFTSEDVDKDFIYWLMRTYDYHWFIVGSASGTSIMHTSPSRIVEYPILLPLLPEQRAIAGVLSSLDDKIDLLHRQNKTLEAMAEALFRQWFVPFGSAQGTGKDGLPAGWVEEIGNMPIEIIDGDRGVNYPKNSDFKPDGYCLFLSAQNVTRNGFDFSYCSFISKIKDDCLNKGKLVQNDIVLTTRGTVGNIAFFMKESHMKMLESIPAWCYLEQLTINYRFYSYIFL